MCLHRIRTFCDLRLDRRCAGGLPASKPLSIRAALLRRGRCSEGKGSQPFQMQQPRKCQVEDGREWSTSASPSAIARASAYIIHQSCGAQAGKKRLTPCVLLELRQRTPNMFLNRALPCNARAAFSNLRPAVKPLSFRRRHRTPDPLTSPPLPP